MHSGQLRRPAGSRSLKRLVAMLWSYSITFDDFVWWLMSRLLSDQPIRISVSEFTPLRIFSTFNWFVRSQSLSRKKVVPILGLSTSHRSSHRPIARPIVSSLVPWPHPIARPIEKRERKAVQFATSFSPYQICPSMLNHILHNQFAVQAVMLW